MAGAGTLVLLEWALCTQVPRRMEFSEVGLPLWGFSEVGGCKVHAHSLGRRDIRPPDASDAPDLPRDGYMRVEDSLRGVATRYVPASGNFSLAPIITYERTE